MVIGNLHFELASVVGALFTATKLILGVSLKTTNAKLKNIELFEKLGYDSDKSMKDLIRSEIFHIITKKTLNIHHINLIFNAYDPRRLLLIYKTAPGFVGFSDTDIIMPYKLSNKYLKALIIALIGSQGVSPLLFTLYLIENSTNKYENMTFFVISIFMLIYSINQLMLLYETYSYYKENDDIKKRN